MSENKFSGWMSGNEEDVHPMFSLYYPKAVHFGVLSGLSFEDAQDCAQEAFTLAFQRRQQLRDVQDFPLWFHRIVVNRVIVALTARQRQSEIPLEIADDVSEERQRHHDIQPEEALPQNEKIWQIVQNLAIKPRLALVLRYYEKFSSREMVGMLDMRESALRITIYSAIERLRSTHNLRSEVEPVEPAQVQEEELVRSVLQAHVPLIVDTEPRWKHVASQLLQYQAGAMHRSIPMQTTLAKKTKVRPKLNMRRRVGLAAAIFVFGMLFVVLPQVVNLEGNHNFWGGASGDFGVGVVGTFHLYSDINQQQQSNGITITVTKAYSDAGRTFIACEVKLSHDLAQRYNFTVFGLYHLSYQSDGDFISPTGNFISPKGQHTDFSHDGTVQNYLLILDPQKSVKNVSITWKISEVSLDKIGVNDRFGIIKGNWDFTFTLPYSTSNLGSGGPFLHH